MGLVSETLLFPGSLCIHTKFERSDGSCNLRVPKRQRNMAHGDFLQFESSKATRSRTLIPGMNQADYSRANQVIYWAHE